MTMKNSSITYVTNVPDSEYKIGPDYDGDGVFYGEYLPMYSTGTTPITEILSTPQIESIKSELVKYGLIKSELNNIMFDIYSSYGGSELPVSMFEFLDYINTRSIGVK